MTVSHTQLPATRAERETLEAILKRPAYESRFKEVLGTRAMQFMSSLLSVGRSMPDVEPRSIVASAMQAATLDLPIEKNLGFAWLVPYNSPQGKFCQFQMGYKGYIQLALRTGRYERMNARPINTEALGGFDSVGEPVILWDKIDETKEAVGYAFGFKLVGGFTKVCYWPKEKVVAHAKRYSQAFRSGKGGPWVTHFDQMALKTVISNELSDWGILSIQWQQARQVDQTVTRDIGATPEYVDTDGTILAQQAPAPVPTPLQMAQEAQQAPAAEPVPTVPNVVPMAQPTSPEPAAATPAPEQRQRRRRTAKEAPAAPAAPMEKFTPAEAAEIERTTGVPVAPEAIQQAAQPEGAAMTEAEEKELAAAGLAPEPPAAAPAAPEPSTPAFTPVPGESAAVTEVRRLCHVAGVTEDQVMKFMAVNNLSSGEKKLTDFTQNQRETKLAALAKTWPIILPRIKAQS